LTTLVTDLLMLARLDKEAIFQQQDTRYLLFG
jgi:hypothetical protein